MDTETFQPYDHGKRRVGRTRLNWLKQTMQDMWCDMGRENGSIRYTNLDLANPDHIELLRLESQSTRHRFNAVSQREATIRQTIRHRAAGVLAHVSFVLHEHGRHSASYLYED